MHSHPRTMLRCHTLSRPSEDTKRKSGGLGREVSGKIKIMEIPYMYSENIYSEIRELEIKEFLDTQKSIK